ncbi:MAG: SCO family protein [Pseudomonadota bacterium]
MRFKHLVIACCTLFIASCSGGTADYRLPDGAIELSDQFSGDFTLIDTSGETRTDEDFRGKVSIFYFGFTTCPDVCPLALRRLSSALDEATDDVIANVKPIFVTVDPKRDTTEIIADYVSFDERFIGLTGTPEAIEDAKVAFKVYASEEKLEGSTLEYTVNHTSLFYVVDREGRPRYALQDTLPPAEIASFLEYATTW